MHFKLESNQANNKYINRDAKPIVEIKQKLKNKLKEDRKNVRNRNKNKCRWDK